MANSSLTRRPLVKETTGGPLMLRDFLIEDFSSCSSNGFKSFPRRRQCCPSTPRLMLPPVDRKSKLKLKSKPARHSKSSSKLFRKASKAVIRAVKSLPLRSSAAAAGGGGDSFKKPLHLLPRSLSRKLLRKSLFWRREEIIDQATVIVTGDVAGGDITAVAEAPVTGRWRSFREFLEEQLDDHCPPPQDQTFLTGKAANLASTEAAGRTSTSSNSTDHSKSDSKNWSESEFTADSGTSEGSNEGGKNELQSSSLDGVSGGSAAVTAGDEASTTTTSWPATAETAKAWTNDQEKEQFSPVSILDCPFQDEEEEEDDGVDSPLQRGLVLDEGSKKKLVKRARRFECLDQLQPINLQKRITVIEESSSISSISSSSDEACSTSHNSNVGSKDPLKLLRIVKERASSSSTSDHSSRSCSIPKGDQLLFLDFFEEKLLKGHVEEDDDEDKLLEAVEEWMNGEAKEMMVGWEVNESRNLYLKDIEENGGWRNYVIDVEQELGLDIEDEIFTSLVNELVFWEFC